MAVEAIKQTYKPMMTVGQVYAKAWGTDGAPKEVGNVLELNLEHSEDVQTQDDMTKLGGGVHAEVRRVKDVKVKMTFDPPWDPSRMSEEAKLELNMF